MYRDPLARPISSIDTTVCVAAVCLLVLSTSNIVYRYYCLCNSSLYTSKTLSIDTTVYVTAVCPLLTLSIYTTVYVIAVCTLQTLSIDTTVYVTALCPLLTLSIDTTICITVVCPLGLSMSDTVYKRGQTQYGHPASCVHSTVSQTACCEAQHLKTCFLTAWQRLTVATNVSQLSGMSVFSH